MQSFVQERVGRIRVTQNLLRTVRLIGEYRGKEALFIQQTPQALETLRQVAIVQSTESSNRIEGVVAPLARIEALVGEKTTPRNRSEQEIAGYRDVLNTIHTNHEHMRLTSGLVRQLHRDLYRYSPTEGGRWKSVDNEIIEELADGTRLLRFRPVPAHATPEAMDSLQRGYSEARKRGEIEPLLMIAAYVLDFLCIHPFLDGNGRVARLLTLLLLYQAGFSVGRYVSLEKIIEDSKESYYESLRASSANWHRGRHDLLPWTEYLLGTIVAAYREFEQRVGTLVGARGAKTEMVLQAVRGLPDGFRIADLERCCPTVTREMIRHVLNRLKKEGHVWCEGAGRAAVWRKRDND
jgi:Fic family protein